jgi:hypothetical protein
LHGGHHKISHGAPLKFSCALEHRMQIGADAGLETSGCGGSGHGFILLIQQYGKLPYSSRQVLRLYGCLFNWLAAMSRWVMIMPRLLN